MSKIPASSIARRPDGLAITALLVALLGVLTAFGTTNLVRGALFNLGAYAGGWEAVFVAAIAATAVLFWPALRALNYSRRANAALARNDIVEARIDTAAALEYSWITIGWSVFAFISLGFISFVF